MPRGGRVTGVTRWGVLGVSGAVNGVPKGVPKGERVCADWTDGSWPVRYMTQWKLLSDSCWQRKQKDVIFFNKSHRSRPLVCSAL